MAQQPFNRNFRKPVQKEDEHRINQRIRVPQVRLVGDNVEQGIFDTAQALAMAQAQSLDLVEIVPTANPPVCRVIDYSKFKYDQKKKQKEIKAKAAKTVIKEIRFGPQTDDHDFEFKLKHAIGFLKERRLFLKRFDLPHFGHFCKKMDLINDLVFLQR